MLVVYVVLPQVSQDARILRFSFLLGNVILWDFNGGDDFEPQENAACGRGATALRFQ
jgi:hypothetical protein